MPRKYRQYTEQDLIEAVKNSFSVADVCRKVGIKPVGGNFNTVQRGIQRLKLDTTHFTGQAWNKGKQLKEIGNYSKPSKIKAVLADKRGWECEHCNKSEWYGKPIPLECHHIDKDRTNNSEDNLQLLCRNCHFWIHDKK